ncbi:hypothetical protein TNCV_668941 [Trichonephila clavipes]|nr:hypothetical protein TNCV_668941 [Trichonephila clavipes]
MTCLALSNILLTGLPQPRLHRETYPPRWIFFHYLTIARVYLNLSEHGSFTAMTDGTHVKSEMDLEAGISIAAATIREMPGIFEHVPKSMSHWCRASVYPNGSRFKHYDALIS